MGIHLWPCRLSYRRTLASWHRSIIRKWWDDFPCTIMMPVTTNIWLTGLVPIVWTLNDCPRKFKVLQQEAWRHERHCAHRYHFRTQQTDTCCWGLNKPTQPGFSLPIIGSGQHLTELLGAAQEPDGTNRRRAPAKLRLRLWKEHVPLDLTCRSPRFYTEHQNCQAGQVGRSRGCWRQPKCHPLRTGFNEFPLPPRPMLIQT